MKILRLLFVFLLFAGIFGTSSCKRDVDTYVPDDNIAGHVIYPAAVNASVNGLVLDENNQVIAREKILRQ